MNTTASLNEYIDVAAAISKITNQTERIEKGLSANGKVTDAISRQIGTLEKGKAENCFGAKSAEWDTVLNALKSKRAELEKERETITKFSRADQKAKPTRGNWQPFLEPSLKAFSACLVLKKRQYLNSGQPRPSPSDFALIIRGACNDEEVQIETEQNKIEGWTSFRYVAS